MQGQTNFDQAGGVVSSQKSPNDIQEPRKSKIQIFEQKMGAQAGHHEDKWKRKTNLTGAGATHVRSFHCKLTSESLELMDQAINQWLDNHPDYEVKQVTTSIGEWTSKLKEPHLIVNVWV